jgi:hypothetical protein
MQFASVALLLYGLREFFVRDLLDELRSINSKFIATPNFLSLTPLGGPLIQISAYTINSYQVKEGHHRG